MKRRAAQWLFLCCAAGCGLALQPRAAEPVLELTLARPDGSSAELTSLRHQPTLLFMFATYDATSQFALAPLQRFLEQEKRVGVIGIALQPDAKAFLELYQRSLDLPFALFYDPGNVLLQGQTVLGRVRAVPSYVALDGEGHIRRQHVGIASAEQLRALADSALQD